MSNRINQAKSRHPAEIYNEKRRIVFSTVNKDPALARTYLNGYRTDIGPKGYAGLNAELTFFERHRSDFQLVPALDAGDATDFSGVIDGKMHRIDVTTNLDYKRLASYEPLQARGEPYKIAVFDGTRFELFDVNFPFCRVCGTGRVLPTAALLGENYNSDGESQWCHDQLLVEICGSCGDYGVIGRETTFGFFDFGYWYNELNMAKHEAEDLGEDPPDIAAEIRFYAANAMRYLGNRFGRMLVGVGGPHYQITDPRNGDGIWQYQIELMLPLVQGSLAQQHPWSITDG
jgi:hypothetical protein